MCHTPRMGEGYGTYSWVYPEPHPSQRGTIRAAGHLPYESAYGTGSCSRFAMRELEFRTLRIRRGWLDRPELKFQYLVGSGAISLHPLARGSRCDKPQCSLRTVLRLGKSHSTHAMHLITQSWLWVEPVSSLEKPGLEPSAVHECFRCTGKLREGSHKHFEGELPCSRS